jgi:hypothetical protein
LRGSLGRDERQVGRASWRICESASGLGADRRHKPLILLYAEGALDEAELHGVYKRRTTSTDSGEIQKLSFAEKLGPTVIAWRLGSGRTSVYRALATTKSSV